MNFITPLFVPGHRPDRFAKAAASGADAVIIDLEDAVPLADKALARQSLRADFSDLPILIRLNARDTAHFIADLAAAAALPFSAIILPKADLEGVQAVAKVASQPIVALIESAVGLASAREIARHPQVVRLAFGSIDYSADLGCQHTWEALLTARCELVLASRLAGIAAPLDGVTASIDNAALAEDDTRHAAALGFGGKLCIHPKQIAPVRNGFSPSEAEIVWARRILASGDGAVAVDGEMVDAPVRLRAEAILQRAGVS